MKKAALLHPFACSPHRWAIAGGQQSFSCMVSTAAAKGLANLPLSLIHNCWPSTRRGSVPHPVDGGMAAIADEVVGLLDHLGIKDAVIVGHSMGGMLAQALAAMHPSLCKGLVLSCTHKGRAQPPESQLSADIERRLADRATLDNAAYGHLRVSSMLDGPVAPEVLTFWQ